MTGQSVMETGWRPAVWLRPPGCQEEQPQPDRHRARHKHYRGINDEGRRSRGRFKIAGITESAEVGWDDHHRQRQADIGDCAREPARATVRRSAQYHGRAFVGDGAGSREIVAVTLRDQIGDGVL